MIELGLAASVIVGLLFVSWRILTLEPPPPPLNAQAGDDSGRTGR